MKATWLKVAFFGIPVLIFSLTVLFLNSSGFLKRPLTGTDDVPGGIEMVTGYSLTERWDEADRSVTDLLRAWEQVKRRVAWTASARLLEDMDMELAEMRAAVEARDAAQVRINQRRLEVLWADIGR